MEEDIRLNIDHGWSLENIIEEMLLNMEAYNYDQGEEERFIKIVKEVYQELIIDNK